ncbi:MAG: UDP-N-acetylmuramate--L-alanine ligase [Clostridia bacterium]|nr:UDP-N-acetylmuramate--L-alanine ligase [Clostridia bacterium]
MFNIFEYLNNGSKNARLHFIGIGGVGMYSLARLALKAGAVVSGSERSESDLAEELRGRGCKIYIGHSAENITPDIDAVVYSHAIGRENPELSMARDLGISTYSRSELLGLVMKQYENRIGISGTHGKSTVCAMLAHILKTAGLSPTVACGAPIVGKLPFLDGGEEHFVYEACEYRDSFLDFYPTSVVITNIELDHTDYFPTLEEYKGSFLRCINRAEKSCILNVDDPNIRALLPLIETEAVTVGTSASADFSYSPYSFLEDGIIYSLSRNNKLLGRFKLKLAGEFNLMNAALAIAAVSEYGVDPKEAATALESFAGVRRRCELVGAYGGRAVYYDYAHHPTEIRAVINALRARSGALTVIFTPHTYTRTRDLWQDFISALSLADFVILTDIFAAREEPVPNITSKRLAEAIGDRAFYSDVQSISGILNTYTYGDIVVMGAGENTEILSILVSKNG